jgi:proton-dependent oligopeptide transporter, POT family
MGSTGIRLGFTGHPRGLSTLFMTELWERFSYYGMRALLVLYMTAPALNGGLAWPTSEAGRIYGNYTMAIYLLAIPGGFIADTMLGPRRAILSGGTMIAAGHFALAIPATASFYAGLVLIALGSGLFKPSISALVGALYEKGDARRDAGFSIFYMGINIGALMAPLVTGFLAQSAWFKARLAANGFDPALSWHWGFAAAGVGMVLALVSFASRATRDAPDVAPGPGATQGWTPVSTALVAAGTVVLMGLAVVSDQPAFQWLRAVFVLAPAAAIAWFARAEDLEVRRLAAVFVFFIASMLFWAVFEQAGTSITLFADRLTNNEIFGYAFPSSWYQALNPLFVIALAPVLAGIWLRLGARQPSAALKFTIGLGFLAASLVLMVPAAQLAGSGKISPWWLAGLFFLQTIGELCVSPVGLSIMTKLAPPGRTAILLGIWFLAAAWGSKLAGIMGSRFSPDAVSTLAWFFLEQAIILAVAIAAMVMLMRWIDRLMEGVE